MHHFTVIAVGKMKDRALRTLVEDFSGRLKRQGKFDCVELKDGTVESEGRRILEAIDKRPAAKVYALAEEGRLLDSVAFAKELGALQGQRAVFIIGGAFGLSDAVKRRADERLSLSPMTFTHEIARVLLCEQFYRAVSILSGSNYHHA